MKVSALQSLILIATTTAGLSFAQAGSLTENDYLKIKSITVTEVADSEDFKPMAPARMMDNCGADSFRRFSAPNELLTGLAEASATIDAAEGVFDKIVNFGKKLINLVSEGRPVTKTDMEVAHAMPFGVECWADLHSWAAPKSTAYRVVYTNMYNMNVVDFTYRLSYVYGGQLEGRGRYITQATVTPAQLDVSWGFTFNAKATVPTVFNMGTKSSPVAGMQMDVKWSVDTLLQHKEQTDSYGLNGLGLIQRL